MAKGLILISGVNGYIAAVAAKYFLDRGHSVRGTVRKASSAQALIDGPLKSYAESGKFTVEEVPDITVEGAFDQAVKGVTAIAHLASPVSMTFTDPAPILHAAINGTKTILNSAHQFAGPQLKSVVVMSSIASTRPVTEPPYTISENDWNDFAEKLCEEHGTATPGPVIYSASKAAAERAFWKFQEDKKPSWSMASVNPVFVIGPSVIPPATPQQVAGTTLPIYSVFSGSTEPFPPSQIPQVVDVRDVAELILYAIEHPDKTNGERYIASSGVSNAQAFRDILREEFSDEVSRKRIAEGEKGKGYSADYQEVEDKETAYVVDSRKARKVLERGEWISLKKSVVDTARGFVGLV
ncbi:hypothetical protein BDU57DRAFT_440157 [Ampelomyces quisqualis]|uniref:NAD-dependent epimerase/dehydratase domain-containing protein n=1 Tax=Ampelomyces quisqualis TaxID=50730 RepID=A0A6A5QYD5_AMPQU|nr:hypothetical protein BDU57DRAFT_440157 [Ampelomyces quisqualis]